LVSKKNIYQKGPKIVVIGGGTGTSNVLRGLKEYTSNITAITTVASYGEPQTKEAKELRSTSWSGYSAKHNWTIFRKY